MTSANTLFDVMKNGKPEPVDDKLMPFLKQENAQTDVFPLVNNFDPISNAWKENIDGFLNNPEGRKRFREELAIFLSSDKFKGLTLDFEGFALSGQPGYKALVAELAADLHARGMKLYLSVPPHNEDFDYKYMSAHADGLILMNYDQHFPGGEPGPVAGQDWFANNLQNALKMMPREKIICAIGNYGYDWATIKGQEAVRRERA